MVALMFDYIFREFLCRPEGPFSCPSMTASRQADCGGALLAEAKPPSQASIRRNHIATAIAVMHGFRARA